MPKSDDRIEINGKTYFSLEFVTNLFQELQGKTSEILNRKLKAEKHEPKQQDPGPA